MNCTVFDSHAMTAIGRFPPVTTGRKRPRLCENTCAVLKSALLRKIRQRLVNQQTGNLRSNAIFVPFLTVKLDLKRFHTAWVRSSHCRNVR